MLQQADFKEYDDVFQLSTVQDVMRLFNDESLSFRDITKIRRWVRHAEKETQKFQKRMEGGVTGDISDKKTLAERAGIGWWILDELEKAMETLKKAGTHRAHAFLARCLADQCRASEALEHLNGLEKAAADDLEVLALKAGLLIESADIAGAETTVARMVKLHAGDPETMKAQARLAAETGEPGEGIDLLRKALDVDPVDEEALFQLGNLLDRFGYDDEALACMEKAGELFPVRAHVVLNLGQMCYERGDMERAAFCFKRVLKTNPAHPLARRFLEDVLATENMYYDEHKVKKQDELNKVLEVPVTDFELSVRSRNCLARMDIRTLGDLIQKTEMDLLSFTNFGETSLAEIKRMLASKNLFLGMAKEMENQELKEKQKHKILDVNDSEILQKPIEDLDLSVRAAKCLTRMGICTFGELIKYDDAALLKMRNFGQTSLNEIKQKLAGYGLVLASH
ncbi:MAG: DNA-directed RNA polymerase subunit alpha C-terminal domain-containing protein [Planctomycetota bacterium]